ncbi:MAG: hypothetical protein ACYCQI_08390 [Gammaproteobacteria bacterium]
MSNLFKKCFWSLLVFSLLSTFAIAREDELPQKDEVEPPAIGNFALPYSQQIGPLVSFGQNTLNKNQVQLFLTPSDYAGKNQHFVTIDPSVVYGITDELSLLASQPIAASYQFNSQHSAGLADATLQLEYSFYSKSTSKYFQSATVVGNITLPTGSSNKKPPTGFGSPSFFIGGTFSRMYVDWYAFTSLGAQFTTSHGGTQFGDNYLYQFGLGRNICNIDSRWVFAWLVEADGTYSTDNRLRGHSDHNSGGNIVYITPSFWASSKKLIAQFGVGVPVVQNLHGHQNRESYLLIANLGWTIR